MANSILSPHSGVLPLYEWTGTVEPYAQRCDI